MQERVKYADSISHVRKLPIHHSVINNMFLLLCLLWSYELRYYHSYRFSSEIKLRSIVYHRRERCTSDWRIPACWSRDMCIGRHVVVWRHQAQWSSRRRAPEVVCRPCTSVLSVWVGQQLYRTESRRHLVSVLCGRHVTRPICCVQNQELLQRADVHRLSHARPYRLIIEVQSGPKIAILYSTTYWIA